MIRPSSEGSEQGVLYYRCEFPAEYAVAKDKHLKTIYVHEDSLTPAIDQWLAQLFDDEHVDDTCVQS